MNLQEIKTVLKDMDLSDLINLYLEAKTERDGLIGELPFIYGIDPIRQLEESINELLDSLN